MTTIDQVCAYILSNTNPKIILLRRKEVVQWIFGDLSFLPCIEKKNKTVDETKYKLLEDKWVPMGQKHTENYSPGFETG